MAPVVVAAIIVAAAQYYQAEKARGANKSELNKIKAQFDAIKPPEWNVTADDPVDHMQQLPVPPNYDMTKITPQTITMVGKYSPEIAQHVMEQAPELAKATEAAQKGRQAQLTALERYTRIGEGEADPELQQAMSEAARRGDREGQSRQASVLQDSARRGTLGSGAMLAGQLQSSSDASERAASSEQAAAVASYRNRLNALSQGAQIGGQVRSSEMGEQQNNADIINAFNQRQASGYQTYLNNAATTANDAQKYNLGEEQRIQEVNAGNKYQSDSANRDYRNKIQDTTYNRALTERDKQYQTAQTARSRNDQLMQQMYNNKVSQATEGRTNAQATMNQNNQNAQATNQQIQGVGDVAANYYGGVQARDFEAEQRQKDREAYLGYKKQ